MTIRVSSSPGRPQECYSVKFSRYHSESAVFTRSINRTCGLCARGRPGDPLGPDLGMKEDDHDFDSNVLYLLQSQSPYCQLSQTAWKQCSVYLRESPSAPWVFSDETVSLQSLTHAHKLCDIIKYSVLLVLLQLLTEVLYWNAETRLIIAPSLYPYHLYDVFFFITGGSVLIFIFCPDVLIKHTITWICIL